MTNTKMKMTLVLNGKSAGKEDVRTAVNRLRSEGYSIEVRVTWEGGDANRFAQEATRIENSVVVAGGGDGTVNEVLGGLLESGRNATMAILPLGTANDFATSANIPIGDPYAALKLAATGNAFAVDVGLANGYRFLNLASGGFGAEVTTQTPIELKNTVGGGAYALMAILLAMKAHPYRGKLITPDKTYEGSMVMMAVGNGRQAGGGAHMTPHAFIDDGLFDVMIVPNHEHARFAHLLTDMLELRHGETTEFHYLRLSRFSLESDDMLQFNLDGEPVRDNRFEFNLLPGALRIVLPEECPLLSKIGAKT